MKGAQDTQDTAIRQRRTTRHRAGEQDTWQT